LARLSFRRPPSGKCWSDSLVYSFPFGFFKRTPSEGGPSRSLYPLRERGRQGFLDSFLIHDDSRSFLFLPSSSFDDSITSFCTPHGRPAVQLAEITDFLPRIPFNSLVIIFHDRDSSDVPFPLRFRSRRRRLVKVPVSDPSSFQMRPCRDPSKPSVFRIFSFS